MAPTIRERFGGPLVLNGGYDARTATAAISSGRTDLVSFGRPFIANPDLPERVRRNRPLQAPDPARFYGDGAEGYTDHPTMDSDSD